MILICHKLKILFRGLSDFRIDNTIFQTISNCDKNKITTLIIQHSNIINLPDLSEFFYLSTLDLSHNSNISNIEVIEDCTSIEVLGLMDTSLHERMIDFSKLTNLKLVELSLNTLWTEDLEKLKTLKNNSNIRINLTNNSIIDASALLELNNVERVDLRNNLNLTQTSKDALKAKFGSKVLY